MAEASVLMTRSAFDPSTVDTSTTDLARQALRDRTLGVPAALLSEMIDSKYEDPMLGIYGGHLMLMRDEPDRGMLATVVENLRNLIGAHPDVDALALALDPDAEVGSDFSLPPMLWSSWSLVSAASATRHDLMPPGSLSESIAGHVIDSDTWLIWTVARHATPAEVSARPEPTPELATAVVALAGAISGLSASGASIQSRPSSEIVREEDLDFERIAEDIVGYATILAERATQRNVPIAQLVSDDVAVIKALDVPRSAAEQALGAVMDQLDL